MHFPTTINHCHRVTSWEIKTHGYNISVLHTAEFRLQNLFAINKMKIRHVTTKWLRVTSACVVPFLSVYTNTVRKCQRLMCDFFLVWFLVSFLRLSHSLTVSVYFKNGITTENAINAIKRTICNGIEKHLFASTSITGTSTCACLCS